MTLSPFHQLQEPSPIGDGLLHIPQRVGQLAAAHLLIVETPDGPDYTLVCHRHRWASLPSVDVPRSCPECQAQLDGAAGRIRYVAIREVSHGQ